MRYKVEGKAELVHGEIVHMPPAGDDPSVAGGEIFVSLHEYAKRNQRGRAYPDGTGFHVNLPHREAFGPDVAFHVGPRTGMRFLEGAPIFAVEVRSENDYGRAAERDMAAKRADYFACGTLVVWDVDALSEDVIKVYRGAILITRQSTGAGTSRMRNQRCRGGGWRWMSCLGEMEQKARPLTTSLPLSRLRHTCRRYGHRG